MHLLAFKFIDQIPPIPSRCARADPVSRPQGYRPRAGGRAPLLVSPGRSTCAPLSLSVKTRLHPALSSASSCISRFWSRVDTRAYPIRIGLKFSLRRQILDTRIEEEETRRTNREWFSRTLKRPFWSILRILASFLVN